MTPHPPPEPDRADRTAIVLILAIGVFCGGFVAGLGLIGAAFRVIDPAGHPVHLLADIPVEAGAGILSAHGDRLVVATDELSGGPLWLLATGDLVNALMIGIVTASFAYVLWRIAQRRPFHRSMQVAVLITGCAVAFGSLLSQGLGGLGQMMAADELNPALNGRAVVAFEFAPLPLIVGFGIMALAFVFRYGARLQHDTEGLV